MGNEISAHGSNFVASCARSKEVVVRAWLTLVLALMLLPGLVRADGPADNLVDGVPPIPPRGIKVAESDRKELEVGLEKLHADIEVLRGELAKKSALSELLPDVQIYDKAVRWALTYHEFFNEREIPV